MRYVFGLVFLVAGNLAFGVGCRMALTGKNMSGLLGRGFTASDNLRLNRAPAVYFRAVGSMVLSLGLLAVWIGIVFLTIPKEADYAYLGTVLSLAGLLLVALLGSAAWITVVATRYKLFRWNKP